MCRPLFIIKILLVLAEEIMEAVPNILLWSLINCLLVRANKINCTTNGNNLILNANVNKMWNISTFLVNKFCQVKILLLNETCCTILKITFINNTEIYVINRSDDDENNTEILYESFEANDSLIISTNQTRSKSAQATINIETSTNITKIKTLNNIELWLILKGELIISVLDEPSILKATKKYIPKPKSFCQIICRWFEFIKKCNSNDQKIIIFVLSLEALAFIFFGFICVHFRMKVQALKGMKS